MERVINRTREAILNGDTVRVWVEIDGVFSFGGVSTPRKIVRNEREKFNLIDCGDFSFVLYDSSNFSGNSIEYYVNKDNVDIRIEFDNGFDMQR